MIIKITDCYETGIGTIVTAQTPLSFVFKTNMIMDNGQNGFWKASGLFWGYIESDGDIDYENEHRMVLGSFRVTEINNTGNRDVNLKDYFLKHTWELKPSELDKSNI